MSNNDYPQSDWASLVSTLRERGLLHTRPQQGGYVYPVADAYLLSERTVYVLDMQRLGGVPREAWLSEDLRRQWRAALGGRRVYVTDSAGLAVTVAHTQLETAAPVNEPLRKAIPLTRAHLAPEPYRVLWGFTKQRTPIYLDIAGEQRAMLVGGTSGYGKTNGLANVLMRLDAKHPDTELQLAIIDPNQVDFTGDWARLPHLYAPVAYSVESGSALIAAVDSEMERRLSAQHAAEVNDWRKLPVPPPLLVLVVDEAADFGGSEAMKRLVQVARKGRAAGISVIVGTQHPTVKVIDAQVKANLPTAIAFRTKSESDSRTILGEGGAAKLRKPGHALLFLDDWVEVLTLYVDEAARTTLLRPLAQERASGLTPLEAGLVKIAIEELDGKFIVNQLYAHEWNQTGETHRISRKVLIKLAQEWEARGWLTARTEITDGREVTPELRQRYRAVPGGSA